MKPDSILYYPHIEFQDEAWVKSCLLIWDHVYRIVPDGYTPNDSKEIKALVDEDMVRDIKLDDKDKADTFSEFLSFCDIIENKKPAGLFPSDEERIHPGKIDSRLYPYLDLIEDHFIDEDNWLHLSKELARGYMFILSKTVARIRNLNRGTDDLDAWSINPYFSEKANFDELLQDPMADGFFCSVTLKDVVPQNIGEVSSRDIISFVNHRKDERKLLRDHFNNLTSHLAEISNKQHAEQIRMDYVKELIDSKEQYRNSMDNWKNTTAKSIITGVPISLSVLGMIADFRGDPFNIVTIAGSIALGAICSYANYNKAKKRRDPSYASYLVGLDKLCGNITMQSYTRLEEFIND